VVINKRSKIDPERAKKMLEIVSLAERADHLPSRLSGGEQMIVIGDFVRPRNGNRISPDSFEQDLNSSDNI
jgi:hypothetical protein